MVFLQFRLKWMSYDFLNILSIGFYCEIVNIHVYYFHFILMKTLQMISSVLVYQRFKTNHYCQLTQNVADQ